MTWLKALVFGLCVLALGARTRADEIDTFTVTEVTFAASNGTTGVSWVASSSIEPIVELNVDGSEDLQQMSQLAQLFGVPTSQLVASLHLFPGPPFSAYDQSLEAIFLTTTLPPGLDLTSTVAIPDAKDLTTPEPGTLSLVAVALALIVCQIAITKGATKRRIAE